MLTVLIVEDEIYARQSLRKQLEKCEWPEPLRILEAVNGEQGLEQFLEEEPELLLTDIRMPRMDGLELLKAVKEREPEAIVVMLSAYSDFEYARNALTYGAVDYLLKPIEDKRLRDCLDRCLNRRSSRKREAMIAGQDMAARYILQTLQNNSFQDFVGSRVFQKIFAAFRVLNIYIYRNPEENRGVQTGRESCSQSVLLLKLEEMFGPTLWTGYRLVQYMHGIWTLVVNTGQDCGFLPRKIWKAFAESGCESMIGVSLEYHRPEDLRCAYTQALHALEHKLFKNGPVFTADPNDSRPEHAFIMSGNEEMLLWEALKGRNAAKLKTVLSGMFARIKELKQVQIESLELLLSQLVVMFRKIIQASGNRETGLRESSVSLLDFNSLEEMERYLVQIGTNICEMYRDESDERDVLTVLTEYVQLHYDQDVTIKELAEKVLYMNPAYVSHTFAEKKGISFSAWLRQIRMEHARQLLEDTDLSVTEAAAMSGYNDASQFIRIFKQETGMTPKKYRNTLGQKREGRETQTKERNKE